MSRRDPPNKQMTQEDERKIISSYRSGLSGLKILKELGYKFKTTKSIYDVLRKHHIDRKTPQDYVDAEHFFFNRINSVDKAYLLGLMISDGWNNQNKGEAGIQLQKQDSYIIEWIAAQWKSTRKILTCTKKPFQGSNGKIYTSQPMKRITVGSHQISKDLTTYGVTQRKSLTAFLPVLEDQYMPHLLRGIMDGDGTIYEHSNKKQICIRFLGSQFLIAGIGIYLTIKLNISQQRPNIKGLISYVEWSIPNEVKQVLRFLYQDGGMKLERKYAKAQDYLS